MKLNKLDENKKKICENTISANAFLGLVGDALLNKNPLSVVRMADGERQIILDTESPMPSDKLNSFTQEWRIAFGCDGITCGEMRNRLYMAANLCTYFAPSLSGLWNKNFDVYSLFLPREKYVDNFFPNLWKLDEKIELLKAAQHVLFIHRSRGLADAMQIRARNHLGVKVTYLELKDWRDADKVIKASKTIDAPLVLFSAGPANKHIGPIIASCGKIPKVTLDIGQAGAHWSLLELGVK
jgi:hypothetical protein